MVGFGSLVKFIEDGWIWKFWLVWKNLLKMVGFGSLLKPRSLVVIVACVQDEIIGYVKETSGLNFKIALLRSQFRQRIVGYWNAVWKIVLDLEVWLNLLKMVEFWLNLLKMFGFGSFG
ncbi:hypothetical protein CDAR_608871 [Caerostris darwini]|uniref:Uncharacterized protein n=1 Tax=Caerostris darwini TaxID=1538125 RepID=A0AAV4WIW5_9ARAC|nr:hypothetical protein CDAR_608871 [Caerostris darwini]